MSADHRIWPGQAEDNRALAHAYARIDKARGDLDRLQAEFRKFIRDTVEMMAEGWSPTDNSFVLALPPAELAYKGQVTKEIRLLCLAIPEDLRAALDYGIVAVAERERGKMTEDDERALEFIIAHSKQDFERRATRALQHVGEEVKALVEQLQPHNGNEILAFIKGASGETKHRRPPKVRYTPPSPIVLQEDMDRNTWEQRGWWMLPVGKGHVLRTSVDSSQLIIRRGDKEHDVLVIYPMCIEHVQLIVNTLEFYLRHGYMER